MKKNLKEKPGAQSLGECPTSTSLSLAGNKKTSSEALFNPSFNPRYAKIFKSRNVKIITVKKFA